MPQSQCDNHHCRRRTDNADGRPRWWRHLKSPPLLSHRRYPIISGGDVTCFRFHEPIKLESFRVRAFLVRDSSGFRGDSCRVSEFSTTLGNFVHLFKVMPPKKSKKANKHNQDWADDDDDSTGESVAFCTLYP